jgi:hypothetical protein
MRTRNSAVLAVMAMPGLLVIAFSHNMLSDLTATSVREKQEQTITQVLMKSDAPGKTRGRLFFATAVVTTRIPSLGLQAPGPQTTTPIALKDRYRDVEVEKFDVTEGVQFPPEYIQSLQDEIIRQFGKSEKFAQVLLPGQNPTDAAASVLRLTGTVTYFDPGNRGKRYIGFGLGAGQIVVHVAFRDRSTGETLATEEVTATLSGGAFGGKAEGITREFAQRLVTTTKLLLEKPAPPRGESATTEAAGLPRPTADHKVVTISGDKFDQGQIDLNSEAAAGYRLVAFLPKGSKSADATVERSATPPQVYQYRVLHVRMLPNLQKDLNKAALDGYRYCPHTLVQLSGAVAVAIAEKPPVPSNTRYEYRMHAAMRVSNAQKDLTKDQRENFDLVGTLEVGGMHVVLMEKGIDNARE